MDLVPAKRKLTEALGECCPTYWNTLRQWYKQKITKADFDDQARLLLGEPNIHLHNEFLFAILAKCQATQPLSEQTPPTGTTARHQSLSPMSSADISSPGGPSTEKQVTMTDDQHDLQVKSSSTKRGQQPNSTCFETVFSPASSTTFMQIARHQVVSELFSWHLLLICAEDYSRARNIQLCSQDMCLPDRATLYFRLLLTALDMGLEDVAEEVPQLVALATEDFIKNILSALVAQRKVYSLRDDHFRYSYSWDPPPKKRAKTCHMTKDKSAYQGSIRSPPYGNKVHSGYHRALGRDNEAAQILSARGTSFGIKRGLISLGELRDVLQIDRQLVPSNAVFCTNMERLLAKMWHSGTCEQQHEEIYKRALQRLAETKATAFSLN